MDETLSKYDQSLQALEEQRESLELVMQRMGAEWEERYAFYIYMISDHQLIYYIYIYICSGAGIGWMGDILFDSNATKSTVSKSTPPPLLQMIQSTTPIAEPSPDYLQALLNVNDALVAQSLIVSSTDNLLSNNDTHDDPATITPSALIASPLTETDVVSHGTAANLISQNILRTQQQDSLPSQFCSTLITPPEEL
jgi:hypothetical protein